MDAKSLKLTSERSRRRLLQVIYNSGAGHTGGDLSCLNLLIVLYFHTLRIDPLKMDDPLRDRFIMSKGHCAEAFFTTLEARGILPSALLDTLGKYDSPLAGHPTNNVPGVEVNTGALGHGLSIGVGMAIAAKMDGLDYHTFVLMGDGEQEEGSIYEAAMAGRQYKLDNLVAFIDRNHLQISGNTEDVMGIDDIRERWTAFGWRVLDMNGDSIEDIVVTLDGLTYSGGQPTLIISHTTKGKGVSFMENVASWHHGVPTKEQYEIACDEISKRIEQYERL